ncbi:DtxR family manganese transport transcriptional regulator [Rhodopseudomonas julia]|uniref:Transcriptional regulator MntR n=1 Tax=Rhodopseudomonas julia TaxID=200617 RepID=A0ABU0C0Z1_9BRAD|nr:manganese-binding transcriptional regulator MntR [Rhodopseudomonas julia]MDQ0324195.1 DtxR family manganese transport transcriptional regulator [Rhodopseudomonas julia]
MPKDKLLNPARQRAAFERVRKAHQSEVAEDYVELIDDLIAVRGEARGTDLVERFGVTHATVNRTIQRLIRDGLVRSEPYRSIFLTDAGKTLAARARERHALVRDFLLAIGTSREIAEQDAEGVEHHVSDETLAAFREFLKRQT